MAYGPTPYSSPAYMPPSGYGQKQAMPYYGAPQGGDPASYDFGVVRGPQMAPKGYGPQVDPVRPWMSQPAYTRPRQPTGNFRRPPFPNPYYDPHS